MVYKNIDLMTCSMLVMCGWTKNKHVDTKIILS